ncbi:endonuclease III [Aminipila butyrica]|uniref:Endonuclease III n=1 Tax=Aminipila butyrica TaxID=433296 RepID=A0A858BVP6_9FIRM|nr:endonuclease III [Aminipila butyrica]QIB70013.1 endonuclease III [Aminipila butyrica]
MKFTKQKIKKLLDKLEEMYPEADCALHFQTIFQLLVAVVLSAQTTDKSVNLVTADLFAKYPDASSLVQVPEEELQNILRRIGMYKTKSRNVLALCHTLIEKYDGQVPEDYDKLVELPGVGRKTANVVLSVGFGHQRIAVDTHVFRVSNRLGLVHEKDVLKTELALMELLPENRWSRTHHSLIFHGRYCCDARKPKCEVCGVSEFCEHFRAK